MIDKVIPYGRQCITDEDVQAVVETLRSDYLTQGPKITEFEYAFARYVGAKYAVAVNNATAGLHLAVSSLAVKPGDKVIVTPMTFAASADCVRYCGGEVVFCDIDKDTYLMDVVKLRQLLVENPKGTFSLVNDILKDIEISTLELDHSSECLGYSLYFKRTPKFNIEKAIKNNVPKLLWQKLQSGKNIVFENIEYSPDMVLGDNRKGIKISFITDTRPILSIPEFINNSDLFICEAMYGDDLDISKAVKNKHMTFREAANLARLGNVKTLLLTHFSPSLEDPNLYIKNATDVFENTIVGKDRYDINLNFEN